MKDQSRATMSLFGRLGVRVQEACISITLPRRDARMILSPPVTRCCGKFIVF